MDGLIKFEIGKIYILTCLTDKNFRSYLEVTKRTDKTIELINKSFKNEKGTFRVKILNNIEFVQVPGNYENAPILRADKILKTFSIIDINVVLTDILTSLDYGIVEKDLKFSVNLALEKNKKLAKLKFDQKFGRWK